MRQTDPGTPLPLLPSSPDIIIAEAGSYDTDDGIRVVLQGNTLMFMASADGTHILYGIDVFHILEALAKQEGQH